MERHLVVFPTAHKKHFIAVGGKARRAFVELGVDLGVKRRSRYIRRPGYPKIRVTVAGPGILAGLFIIGG